MNLGASSPHTPMNMSELADRYRAVKSTLPTGVQLIAVSKKRTVLEIQALYDLGHRAFGENYPQELRDKQPLLPKDIEWHFIGHLQTNKVKYLGGFTRLVHGVDSIKLLDGLATRARSEGRVQDVLLQVHIAQEETKHGFSFEEVRDLWAKDPAVVWPELRICGLMGMASNTENETQVQQEFDGLRTFFLELRSDPLGKPYFKELSMGMSGDVALAVKGGSTMVRIGTAIFGERA